MNCYYSPLLKLYYKFSHDIKAQNTESACFDYCCIGKDIKAKECYQNIYGPVHFIEKQNYQSTNSATFIFDYIKKHQPRIVAINEAHHASEHRIVMHSMLERLYRNGYRHLAIEALSSDDHDINIRKFPKFVWSGNYIKDPEFGNMVRYALKLGFTLIPYDQRGPLRAQLAAEAICNHLTVKQINKLVIFAGFDNISEKEINQKKSMMMYLKECLNTDPFTISQTKYLSLLMKYNPPTSGLSYILTNKNDEVYRGETEDVDVALFCGKKDVDDALVIQGQVLIKIKAPKMKIPFPSLVLAKIKNEGLLAVPVDIAEINTSKDLKKLKLSLFKGFEYIIEFVERNYETYHTQSLTVK
ncbi:MAG: hypothetical protein IPK35_16400 [Saprospiraceae bacterium]|nr:hypothetical protein [Saprospiraceae bacterium]